MMYKTKVAVCSDIRKKTLNAKWAPCRIFLILNLVVREETARFQKVKWVRRFVILRVCLCGRR